MQKKQLELCFVQKHAGRGGARRGAGRKPLALRHTPHRARPVHRSAQPVHVTLRACVRSLRHAFIARTVLRALRDSNAERFRIVHYSVQENHLHLIVEAVSSAALASGVRGLMVRIARRVNPLLFRRGRFWADRWHGQALSSPRQVRNALIYVLQNRKKHARSPHAHGAYGREAPVGGRSGEKLDLLSSAPWFNGFSELPPCVPGVGPPSTAAARTWLLSVGWQRHGRIRLRETPK